MELYFKTENLLFDNFISFGIATQIFKQKTKKLKTINRDKLSFKFLEKVLGIILPPHLFMIF